MPQIPLLRHLTNRPTWLVFLCGIAAVFAMPPLNLLPFYYLAISGLFWALYYDIARLTIWRSFIFGWLFGFGQLSVGLYWIGHALLIEADKYLWLLPFAITLIPAGFALYSGIACGLWAIAMRWQGLRTNALAAALMLAGLLALADYARGYLLTGFPWNIAGMAWGGILALAQSAWLVGIYGMGMLVLVSATAFAAIIYTGRIRPLTTLCALTPIMVAFLFGSIRLADSNMHPPPISTKLAIIQPNITQARKWAPEARNEIYAQMLTHTRKAIARAPDLKLIIWPEAALPFIIDETDDFGKQLQQILPPDMILLTGAVRRDNRYWYNSIMGWDGNGNLRARTDKHHLVPFGEYLPFRRILERIGLHAIAARRNDYAAGAPYPKLAFEGVPITVPYICYEAIFPTKFAADAHPDWLINITNDAWFGNTIGPHQHLAHARLRAIESGLPLIRAANTGISASFDAQGRQRARLELGTGGIIITELPPPQKAGWYSVYGNSVFFILLFMNIIIILCLTFYTPISHITRVNDA